MKTKASNILRGSVVRYDKPTEPVAESYERTIEDMGSRFVNALHRLEKGEVVMLAKRKRYTLAELLAAYDLSQPRSVEECEWLDAPALGREWI